MMTKEQIEDMTKTKYKLYVIYDHCLSFSLIQVRISLLANYLYL